MPNSKEEDRHELYEALLEVLDEAIRVDAAACGKIRVYDPASGSLAIRAQRGFSEDFVRSFEAIDPDDELACARAFRLRHRIAVPDVTADPRSEPYHEAARNEGFRGMQATPVIGSQGQVLGTLSTHYPRVHHPSTSAGVLLDYLSRKAATLLETLSPAQ